MNDKVAISSVMARGLAILLISTTSTFAHTTTLPLGDGNVSASPKSGYVFACQTNFRRGGVVKNAPWIDGNKWYPDEKPTVSGSMIRDAASLSIDLRGDSRVVVTNGLPDHKTGKFPIDRNSIAYSYDRNPNGINEQNILLRLPANPVAAASASCVPMGLIGIAVTGVAIFNALDAAGLDAAAHEVQDNCNGHPERRGMYHYHNLSACIPDTGSNSGGHSSLIGYALDGFGIFGPKDQNGKTLANSDLDTCHGHTETIEWNGAMQEIYHYHATAEYPYMIGCFKGKPVRLPR